MQKSNLNDSICFGDETHFYLFARRTLNFSVESTLPATLNREMLIAHNRNRAGYEHSISLQCNRV